MLKQLGSKAMIGEALATQIKVILDWYVYDKQHYYNYICRQKKKYAIAPYRLQLRLMQHLNINGNKEEVILSKHTTL